MKILLIDDEDDIRTIAHMALSRVGKMDVVEASGGAEGVLLAEKEKPDVILLDFMMPGMDGLQTLKALKDNPATAAIPVIFLTARAMPNEVELLKILGARGVLTKPFQPLTLAREVVAILQRERT